MTDLNHFRKPVQYAIIIALGLGAGWGISKFRSNHTVSRPTTNEEVSVVERALANETKELETSATQIAKSVPLESLPDSTESARSYRYVYLQSVPMFNYLNDSRFTQADVAIGIDSNGYRKWLAVELTNDHLGWTPLLKKLKRTGVENVDLFVACNPDSLDDELTTHFPDSKWQRCYDTWKATVLDSTPTTLKTQIETGLDSAVEVPSLRTQSALQSYIRHLLELNLTVAHNVATQSPDHLTTFTEFPLDHQAKLRASAPMEYADSLLRDPVANREFLKSDSAFTEALESALRKLEKTKWAQEPYIPDVQLETANIDRMSP